MGSIKTFRQIANCYHSRNDAAILLTGRRISIWKGETEAFFVPKIGSLSTTTLQALTVAEEDGVERGEYRAGEHEPLPPPPLTLWRRRPPSRVQLQLLLFAPMKNRVLVPTAVGRRAGVRHRLALCPPELPGANTSPGISARFGDHQQPAPRAKSNGARGRWETPMWSCSLLLRFAPPFCLFLW